MKTETVDLSQVLEAGEGLKRELGRLGERLSALEAAAGKAAPAPPQAKARDGTAEPKPQAAPPPPAPTRAEGLSEELVLVISAAIAAFLGKKAHIRAIRLVGTGAWAQ